METKKTWKLFWFLEFPLYLCAKFYRTMKERIAQKASEMFLKLGFKSITMDDIANEMCISKKTIYKFFLNKEILVEQSTKFVHDHIHQVIDQIIDKNYNAIKENFEIRKMFKEIFRSSDTSAVYQLKKHYPEIYQKINLENQQECNLLFAKNINKGIQEGLYRKDIDIPSVVLFYFNLIMAIKENTSTEKESFELELKALEYHTRAIATEKGLQELEKNLNTL